MQSQQILKMILNVKQKQSKIKQSIAKSAHVIPPRTELLKSSEFYSVQSLNERQKSSHKSQIKRFPSFSKAFYEEGRYGNGIGRGGRERSMGDGKEEKVERKIDFDRGIEDEIEVREYNKEKKVLRHSESMQLKRSTNKQKIEKPNQFPNISINPPNQSYSNNPNNSPYIKQLKSQIQRLTLQKQYLIEDIKQYQMGMVVMKNKIMKLEIDSKEAQLGRNIIEELKRELKGEKLKNQKMLEKLREEERRVGKIYDSLGKYYEEVGKVSDEGRVIMKLERQNEYLRDMLRIGVGQEIPQYKMENINKNTEQKYKQDTFENSIEKLNIRKSKTVNIGEFLVTKLSQIAYASRDKETEGIQQPKSFNFFLPIHNTSTDCDILEDQALAGKK